MECEPSEAKLPLFQEKPEIQIFIGNDVSNIKKQKHYVCYVASVMSNPLRPHRL